MAANRLHLNSDKTKLLIFLRNTERILKLYLPTDTKPVKPVKTHTIPRNNDIR